MNDTLEGDFTPTGSTLAVQAPIAPPQGLFGCDDPDEFIEKAAKYATALKKVIVERGFAKNLGRGSDEYIEIGGWQTLGGMLKVYASCEWTRKLEDGWEARAVVHDASGNQLSAAEAQCTYSERNWKNRDDYALRSMAQTRAMGKAYRSVLGFIVELAGYGGTPAEEMPPKVQPRQSEPNGSAQKPQESTTAQVIPTLHDLEHLAAMAGVDLTEFLSENVRPDYKQVHALTGHQALEAERLLSELAAQEIPL